MNIKNYNEVCESLYPFLRDYLQEHSIDTSRNFRCINPAHDDHNPSMGIAPSGIVFHCFSCGVSGNIFHAAHFLENKPMMGPEFITDTLVPLAAKYKVAIETAPLTEEQIYELDTYRAYKAVADLVSEGKRTEAFEKAVTERQWTPEIIKEYDVGCVSDYKEFRESLKRTGFQASFLDDIDLNRREIFGEDRLIFPVKDEFGRPVGFSSRNLNYTKDSNEAKYVNSTGVKCNIYRKSTRLYGFDRVLARNQKKPKALYVFEGYADVITAAQHGVDCCVALGGTAFSTDQVLLLKQHKYYDIILCLDADEAGQSRTAALLDTTLSGHKDLKIRVVITPEGEDPDKFIRDHGIEKFKKLKKWTAFEWRLSRFAEGTDPEQVCENMIPLIVNETSYVTQEKMCKTLARATGVSLKTIQHELERLQNQQEAEKSRERDNIIERMVQACQRNPSGAENALQEAQDELFQLARRYEEDTFSEESTLSIIQQQKSHEEAKDGSFSGYRLGPDLKALEEALCGEWKKDVWWCIGGKANTGKTSLACKIAYEIARHIEENNATVIYHTIDDTTLQVLPKLICVADGSHHLTLNQVMDPNYHIKAAIANPDKQKTLLEQRDSAYSTIFELVRQGRLIIKDANEGTTLPYISRLIKYYKEKYPDRNIVYILDNFHKLDDFGAGKADERVRVKETSKVIKGLATRYHATVITTVEYRKTQNGQKAGNEDIAETGQIEYDANIISHVHNELHTKGEKCPSYLTHMFDPADGNEPIQLPINEVYIGKNKVTGFKAKLYFEFYPANSDFCGIDAKIIQSRAQMEQDKEQDKNKDFSAGDPFGKTTYRKKV